MKFFKYIISICKIYPFLEYNNFGYSYLGRPLPYIRFGIGSKKVFYSASIHANEWITSILLMKFLENLCKSFVLSNNIYGVNARYIYNNCSIYIAPMINPDGVNLVTGYFKPGNPIYDRAKIISKNYPSIPFPSGWKANIRGVDLNLQFPAGWEKAKKIKFSQGFTSPAPRDYVGSCPLSEPESQAIYNFTLNNDFKLILSYHSQGKVIYWQFKDYNPPHALEIGNTFSQVSGYTLEETPYNSSFAGYKDWFIQNYNLPGYTVEVGLGTNPLPISQFNKIYNDNLGILVLGAMLA